MPFQSYTLDTQGTGGGGYHHPSLSSSNNMILFVQFFIESNYAIPLREYEATFSYLFMCFVPQFTEATDIITFESVISFIFNEILRRPTCSLLYKEIIGSSSNKIFYN